VSSPFCKTWKAFDSASNLASTADKLLIFYFVRKEKYINSKREMIFSGINQVTQATFYLTSIFLISWTTLSIDSLVIFSKPLKDNVGVVGVVGALCLKSACDLCTIIFVSQVVGVK
jgi:hypothetical protein